MTPSWMLLLALHKHTFMSITWLLRSAPIACISNLLHSCHEKCLRKVLPSYFVNNVIFLPSQVQSIILTRSMHSTSIWFQSNYFHFTQSCQFVSFQFRKNLVLNVHISQNAFPWKICVLVQINWFVLFVKKLIYNWRGGSFTLSVIYILV